MGDSRKRVSVRGLEYDKRRGRKEGVLCHASLSYALSKRTWRVRADGKNAARRAVPSLLMRTEELVICESMSVVSK